MSLRRYIYGNFPNDNRINRFSDFFRSSPARHRNGNNYFFRLSYFSEPDGRLQGGAHGYPVTDSDSGLSCDFRKAFSCPQKPDYSFYPGDLFAFDPLDFSPGSQYSAFSKMKFLLSLAVSPNPASGLPAPQVSLIL